MVSWSAGHWAVGDPKLARLKNETSKTRNQVLPFNEPGKGAYHASCSCFSCYVFRNSTASSWVHLKMICRSAAPNMIVMSVGNSKIHLEVYLVVSKKNETICHVHLDLRTSVWNFYGHFSHFHGKLFENPWKIHRNWRCIFFPNPNPTTRRCAFRGCRGVQGVQGVQSMRCAWRCGASPMRLGLGQKKTRKVPEKMIENGYNMWRIHRNLGSFDEKKMGCFKVLGGLAGRSGRSGGS